MTASNLSNFDSLYRTVSANCNLTGELLDRQLAMVQKKLWRIRSQKERIREQQELLDRRWQELSDKENTLHEQYTRIQQAMNNQ